VVDAQDETKKWYESVITGIDADGTLSVHFKGWNPNFDEKVAKEGIFARIQPLFTKTVNWRAKVEEDDSLDVKVCMHV
jgi:hypothetical protein